MSPTNPSFVRLSDRMVSGLAADLESGFAISGYDVQPFPENREQARFVRRKLNAGVLEPATQAEYDEAHPTEEEDDAATEAKRIVDVVKAVSQKGGNQEHVLREKETGRHQAIRDARARAKLEEQGVEVDEDATSDELQYASDKARREALAQEAEDEGLHDDDPEGQKERSATRAKKSGPRRRAQSR